MKPRGLVCWLNKEIAIQPQKIVFYQTEELLLRDNRYLSLDLKKGLKTASMIDCTIKNLDFPESTLIAIIYRKEQIIMPTGQTKLEENDRIIIISTPKGIKELYERYAGK